MTPRHRWIAGCLAATAALAPVAIGSLSPALAGDKGYEICHATESSKNPYVLIHPANAGKVHGHMGHHDGRDIIPPFQYKGREYSQNWDPEGRAIFENGCAVPTTPPVLDPPEFLPPPVQEPPVEEPPAEEPPVEEPPVEEPPVEEPPVEEPPVDEPPVEEELPPVFSY